MNALEYFLKANLYLALFYACYHLALRRHTFFGLNRAYLLLSVLAALLLPLVSLSTQAVENLPVPVGVISLPVTVLSAPEPTGPDWETIGYVGYGLLALAVLIRLVGQLTRVRRIIQEGEQHPREDYVLVLPNQERVPTFSFLQYLVLSRLDARAPHETILAHERVHIRQRHSLDLLFIELVQVVFWINPVLLLYRSALRQVHEFLADQAAVDKAEYATYLVEYAFGVQPGALTHSFVTPSLLKERLLMLQRRATSRWAVWKYALVLPLALGLLAMTSAPEQLQALVTTESDEAITVTGRVLSPEGQPLPGANIVLVNSRTGTTTDAQGSFRLVNVPANGRLAISFVGFQTQLVPMQGRTTLDFQLKKEFRSLNELVVTAYLPENKPTVTPPATAPPAPVAAPAPGGEVFTVVEHQPEFPGGMPALGQYLGKNIRYPAEAVRKRTEGRVFVQFIVGTDGGIRQASILKGIGNGCDEEALRVVRAMPNWRPGRQSGQAVATEFVLPIQFNLDDPNEDSRVAAGGIPDQVLWVIDGVIQQEKPEESRLNPNDIASVDVLKGSSAVNLYGDKGRFGVMLITTKQKRTHVLEVAPNGSIGAPAAGQVNRDEAAHFINDKAVTRAEFDKLPPSQIKRLDVRKEGKGEIRAYTQ